MILIILIILIAAIILNSYITKREAARKEYQHERRQERFERLMSVLQKPDNDKSDNADRYPEREISDNHDPDKHRDKS